MSGGFFRGTSADQDTRFSNKQVKLLKSQKFAPELEHLVDMTKVKMDVIRPWIATRVTELLGFEDEVLINFIYGLLDGKEVNGKQVQISLTGFMEKNTGKFMKELWTLLLSAQRNASGVPQQFLDAKEEETRKKKAESDRIANEIQKKKDKESRELEQERLRKMDDEDERKSGDAELDPSSKDIMPKDSSAHPEDERDADQRNGVGGKRVSKSPHSTDFPYTRRLPSRSVSRSFSNSKSYSEDKQKSRSVSRSPQLRRGSSSTDRIYRSPIRRSLTPLSRHSPRSHSHARQRPSYSRRRSRSPSLRRSPSPVRRKLRSPYRRRPPTPVYRRSRSPIRRHRLPTPIGRHRSPLSIRRRRSPSPVRRHRSPSPVRRRIRSPVRHRSPSPGHRRSPSPVRRRSPPPLRRRSPSPVRRRHRRSSSTPRHRSSSLVRHRSPAFGRRSISPSHGKSPSPNQSSSLSPLQRRSSSPVWGSPKERRSPLLSSGERQQMCGKLSPVGCRTSSVRSSHRGLMDERDAGDKLPGLSLIPNKSTVSESPSHARNQSVSEERRSSSLYVSPMKQRRDRVANDDSFSPELKPRELRGQRDSQGTGRKNEASRSSETPFGKVVHLGTPDRQRSPALSEDSFQGQKQSASLLRDGKRSDESSYSHQNKMDSDQRCKAETSPKLLEKVDHNKHGLDSDSEGSDRRRTKQKEKTKHKRSERREVTSDDDSSYDSEIEFRKEAKRRRRKEEKRLRKEEKRRRREERHHRREERHAEKLKMNDQDNSNSDGERAAGRKSHPNDDDEEETKQKQLEIELRKKALESLKAKKGNSH